MAREPFNTRWAQGVETQNNPNSYQAPSNVRLDTGWEGGQDKDAPPAGQENWWHNRVDTALQDVERQGVMTWHGQAVYGIGAPCYASDGYYYDSLVEGNVGQDPTTSPAYWRQIGRSLFTPHSVAEYKDVAHNGAPDYGWLKCNGAVLLRSAYPKLFSKIGTAYNTGGELATQFRLPDWRGVFPRFLDEGRGIDPGRAISGTLQDSQNKSHTHEFNMQGTPSSLIVAFGREDAGGIPSDPTGYTTGTNGNDRLISIVDSGGSEARPINLVQVRWIRYL